MRGLDHHRAVVLMIGVTLLWSSAGVVTRHLEAARGLETTFWRSAFNALALLGLLAAWRGVPLLWRTMRQGGRALWISGLCWCTMFTAFMVALTLTTVANVLITMATTPLLTAVMARIALGHRMQPRTWGAIAVAATGITWMFAQQTDTEGARHLLGTLVATAVPLAAAVNWTLLQHLKTRRAGGDAGGDDMLLAVLLGAVLSAAVALPLAWPLQATAHDVAWLGVLGVFQLAVPCLLAVMVARVLPAPEIALLGLLEVVFGVVWAWLWAGEAPGTSVLGGGMLVLGALAANELLGARQEPDRATK